MTEDIQESQSISQIHDVATAFPIKLLRGPGGSLWSRRKFLVKLLGCTLSNRPIAHVCIPSHSSLSVRFIYKF